MSLAGFLDPGLEPVRDVLESSLASGADVGAAVAVYHGGRVVLDLWGGEARSGSAWARDTMGSVFSTTKGAVALIVEILADRGVLDVDAPVAAYWPAFAESGKRDITVADVMSHRSGVIGFDGYRGLGIDLTDGDIITERLAAAAPRWEPGTRHGYHALSFGWILGEVVRRLTGASPGTMFRRLVAEPLGLDFWIGLPGSEHHRVADVIDAPPPDDGILASYLALFNPDTWTGQAHFVGSGGLLAVADAFNSPEYRSAEIPAAGGIGTARSLARMYAALAGGGSLDGIDLVSPASLEHFTAERSAGPDDVLIVETRFGLGYARGTALNWYGPNDASFGHGGLGGSVAFADPVAGISFAYVPNQLRFHGPGEPSRSRLLVEALYGSL